MESKAFTPEYWPKLLNDALHNNVDVRGWQAAGGTSVETVLAAYRNNTFEGRVRALQVTFPVVEQLLGEIAFDAYASDYVQQVQAQFADLDLFGDDFDGFLARQNNLQEVPYIAEVASFEWLIQAARFAALQQPLDAQVLEQLSESQLERFSVSAAPTIQTMDCQYNVHDLWLWHKHPETEFQLYRGEYHLVISMCFSNQQGWHIATHETTAGEARLLKPLHKCLLTELVEAFAEQQLPVSETLNSWLTRQWLVIDG